MIIAKLSVVALGFLRTTTTTQSSSLVRGGIATWSQEEFYVPKVL